MTSLDRTVLIGLLERLGSEDDATVLEAARTLNRTISEAGASWDELIALELDDDELEDAPEADTAIPDSPDGAETLRLIDRLLRKGVSETLREDLLDMKGKLADGTLDQGDRRYIRAVAKRLGV
jgi:hypothetical protein